MRSCLVAFLFMAFAVRGAEVVRQKGSVTMRSLGPIRVLARTRTDALPYVTFTDAGGKLLLSVSLGTRDTDIFRVVSDLNTGDRENPLVRFMVLDGPGGASPVVLTMAEFQGGSDCEYVASIVGEHQGRLQTWFDQQPLTNAEGGIYLGDLGNGYGYGFAAWNFEWGSHEAHVDPHRYRVKLYRYQAASGKMVLFSNRVTKDRYDDGKKAIQEFGLYYENVEQRFKDFSC